MLCGIIAGSVISVINECLIHQLLNIESDYQVPSVIKRGKLRLSIQRVERYFEVSNEMENYKSTLGLLTYSLTYSLTNLSA